MAVDGNRQQRNNHNRPNRLLAGPRRNPLAETLPVSCGFQIRQQFVRFGLVWSRHGMIYGGGF
jgi:hypothetical protein